MAIEDAKFIVGAASDDLNNEILTENIPLVNLIRNGAFESWSQGESNCPDAWDFFSCDNINRDYTYKKIGSSSAKMISNTSGVKMIAQAFVNPEDFTVTYTFGCWVKTAVAGKVRIGLFCTSNAYSNWHSGGGAWEFLTVKNTTPAGTNMAFVLYVEQADSGTVTGYFDGAVVVKNMENVSRTETELIFAFAPHPLDVGGEVYNKLAFVQDVGVTDKDKDTGIYFCRTTDDDDIITMKTTGNERVLVDSNGIKLGVGLGIRDLDGDTSIQLEQSADEDKIRLNTLSTERVIIDNNGKVGIGTSAPDEMLHLNGGNIKLDGSHKVTGLAAPSAAGDAIRQTTKITEANLESAVDNTQPWLSGYKYRKSIAINGSADGVQINYQMKVTIHRSTGIDSGGDVYINDKCLTNYNDIRFTTSGNVLLDYWIESYDDSSAVIWVEFDSIPQSAAATFYMYYGNANASTYSNGNNTFLFFDDFSGDLSKWATSGSPAIESGKLNLDPGDSVLSASSITGPYILELSCDVVSIPGSNQGVGDGFSVYDNGSGTFVHSYFYNSGGLAWRIVEATGGSPVYNQTAQTEAVTTYNYQFYSTGSVAKIYRNGSLMHQRNLTLNFNTSSKISLFCSQAGEYNYYKVRVRKYTANEPTIGAWGGEFPLTDVPNVLANIPNMISGCRPKYNTTQYLNIEKGILVIDGYIATIASEISINTNSGPNWEDGSVPESACWAYAYLIKPSSSGGTPTYKLSTTAPSESITGGARYHPTQPTWRFVGSFYVSDGSGTIRKFYVYNDFIRLNASSEVQSPGSATSYTNVSVAPYVPPTAQMVCFYGAIQGGDYVNGDMTLSVASDTSGSYEHKITGNHTPSGGYEGYSDSSEIPYLSSNIAYKVSTGNATGRVSVFGYYEKV